MVALAAGAPIAVAQEEIPPGVESKSITAITLDVAPQAGPRPADLARSLFERQNIYAMELAARRSPLEMNYAWEAPALAYRPLYFEDENLERYGHHYGVFQPVASAANFFGRLPVLPYMHGATPSHQPVYALGYARPGDHVPHFFTLPKPSLRGALYEGAAWTGAVFLIP